MFGFLENMWNFVSFEPILRKFYEFYVKKWFMLLFVRSLRYFSQLAVWIPRNWKYVLFLVFFFLNYVLDISLRLILLDLYLSENKMLIFYVFVSKMFLSLLEGLDLAI